jgi:hypothetical protein
MAITQSMYSRYVKPRLEADEEFRVRYMKQRVEIQVRKLQNDPAYKSRQETRNKTRQRQRYDTDPEYRERQKKKALENYYKKKALKLQHAS